MGIMAQEETLELSKRLRAVQVERDTALKQAERMEGLWRDQTRVSSDLEKRVAALGSSVKGLEQQLASVRAVAQQAQAQEQRADEAEKALGAVQAERDKVFADRDRIRVERDAAQEGLLVATHERDGLAAEIGPFRALIAAMKLRADADEQIAVNLKGISG